MKHVIIGNGIAGISAAEIIRKNSRDDEIIMISNEAVDPYWRASLSKYILDIIPPGKMDIKPPPWFEQFKIQQVQGEVKRVEALEKKINLVSKAEKQIISFDQCCIAIGADPISLPIPGNNLPEVLAFRSLEHANYLKNAIKSIKHVVVIGGGVLGMEVVELAVTNRIKCTVLQRGNLIGTPLVDEIGAEILLKRITGEDGVHPTCANVIFGDGITEFLSQNGHLSGIRLQSNREIPCDLAVVCIGISTDPEIFKGSGLNFDRGLIVDEHQQTNIDGIYGAGDCVIYPNESGRFVPTRTWVTSRIQGKTAGYNMCGIPCLLFDEGPMYNASYLFDLLYTVIGEFNPQGEDYQSFQYQPDAMSYRKVIFKKNRIVGAMMLGDRNGDQAIRRLIAQNVEIDSDEKKRKLLDPAFDPNDLAKEGIEYIMY
jgi:NAD(P)H-nitrite reductase large subunit